MALSISEIILDGLTSDPTSPSNGTIWYRSDLNELRIRINGVTKVFIVT